MSLKVWLPLNGDIKNYGSYQGTITNTGAVSDSVGKIGSCYYFDGSDDSILVPFNDYVTTEWSFCCWFYKDSLGEAYDTIFGGPGGFEIESRVGSSDTHSIHAHSWGGGTIPYDFNRWYHLAVTRNENETKWYLDGELKLIGTAGSIPSGNYYIGAWRSDSEQNFKGKLNDVRIYDHCLSYSEVKELSKGLVAHYPLNDPDIEPTVNYCLQPSNYSSSTPNWDTTLNGTTAYTPDGWGDGYNGGVEDPTHGYHARWIWMNNQLVMLFPNKNSVIGRAGRWLGISKWVDAFANPSITPAGIKYTISLEQMTDTLGTYTAGGIYYKLSSSYPDYSFWDDCPVLGRNTKVGVWEKFSVTFTRNSSYDGTYTGGGLYIYGMYGEEGNTYVRNVQVEVKDHATPYVNGTRTSSAVNDCSGYKRDLNVSGTILPDTSPRNKIAYDFNQTGYLYKEDLELRLYAFTVSFWVKSVSSTTDQHFIFGTFNSWTGNGLGMWRDHNQNGYSILLRSTAESSHGMAPVLYIDAPYNTWVYFAWTWDGTSTKVYRNGGLVGTVSYGGNGYCYCPNIFLGNSMFGNRSTETSEDSMSDFKLYATALSADDISQEYHTYASIYNNQTLKACEFIEPISANLLEPTNTTLTRKVWGSGLSAYTQENCNVTLTDNGYRIYRAPNLTVSGNGYVMWGGLVIKPYDVYGRDMLIKGHTYILKFHVKGQSSNGSEFYWTNQCGWGGGGLEPSPDNVSYQMTPGNFQGEMECFYKWTINDDVWKVCTNSYSGFTAGNTYLSYRDFKYGFTYDDTGSLGTDLYITDIRMYDITAGNVPVKISTKGVCYGNLIEENFDKVSFNQGTEVYARQFIEV